MHRIIYNVGFTLIIVKFAVFNTIINCKTNLFVGNNLNMLCH